MFASMIEDAQSHRKRGQLAAALAAAQALHNPGNREARGPWRPVVRPFRVTAGNHRSQRRSLRFWSPQPEKR